MSKFEKDSLFHISFPRIPGLQPTLRQEKEFSFFQSLILRPEREIKNYFSWVSKNFFSLEEFPGMRIPVSLWSKVGLPPLLVEIQPSTWKETQLYLLTMITMIAIMFMNYKSSPNHNPDNSSLNWFNLSTSVVSFTLFAVTTHSVFSVYLVFSSI